MKNSDKKAPSDKKDTSEDDGDGTPTHIKADAAVAGSYTADDDPSAMEPEAACANEQVYQLAGGAASLNKLQSSGLDPAYNNLRNICPNCTLENEDRHRACQGCCYRFTNRPTRLSIRPERFMHGACPRSPRQHRRNAQSAPRASTPPESMPREASTPPAVKGNVRSIWEIIVTSERAFLMHALLPMCPAKQLTQPDRSQTGQQTDST